MRFVEYPDREMMALDVAQVLADEIRDTLHHNARATFVVPGGTTPGDIFDDLCAVDLDWDRVDVMLSDERWVGADHPRSNAGLLARRLFVDRAKAAVFLPFYTGSDRPDTDLPEVEAMIQPHLPISVALLGMGADMHFASLFPGADNLALGLSAQAPMLVPILVEGQEPRVSFSARVLREALSVHVVITGQDKREALERAVGLPPMEAPIAAILDKATVHWAA